MRIKSIVYAWRWDVTEQFMTCKGALPQQKGFDGIQMKIRGIRLRLVNRYNPGLVWRRSADGGGRRNLQIKPCLD